VHSRSLGRSVRAVRQPPLEVPFVRESSGDLISRGQLTRACARARAPAVDALCSRMAAWTSSRDLRLAHRCWTQLVIHESRKDVRWRLSSHRESPSRRRNRDNAVFRKVGYFRAESRTRAKREDSPAFSLPGMMVPHRGYVALIIQPRGGVKRPLLRRGR